MYICIYVYIYIYIYIYIYMHAEAGGLLVVVELALRHEHGLDVLFCSSLFERQQTGELLTVFCCVLFWDKSNHLQYYVICSTYLAIQHNNMQTRQLSLYAILCNLLRTFYHIVNPPLQPPPLQVIDLLFIMLLFKSFLSYVRWSSCLGPRWVGWWPGKRPQN